MIKPSCGTTYYVEMKTGRQGIDLKEDVAEERRSYTAQWSCSQSTCNRRTPSLGRQECNNGKRTNGEASEGLGHDFIS